MLERIKMILAVTLASALAGAILAFAYSATKEAITVAEKDYFLKELKKILPDSDNDPYADKLTIKGREVYVARKGVAPLAYAMETASSKGYGGGIKVLISVDPSGAVLGAVVLEHWETPGLGDKITEKSFLETFIGLKAEDKIAVKKDGGSIDQFTGATISPRAVAEAVKNGLEFLKNEGIAGE